VSIHPFEVGDFLTLTPFHQQVGEE